MHAYTHTEPFQFSRYLTLEVLEEEVLALCEEQQATSTGSIAHATTTWTTMHKAAITLDAADTLGTAAVGAVQTIANTTASAMVDFAARSRTLRQDRVTLMKARSRLHMWVDHDVRSQAEDVANGHYEGGECWLVGLTEDVVEMLVGRVKEREFHPSRYGLEWDCEDVSVTNTLHKRYLSRSDKTTTDAAVRIVLNVVRGWLNLDGYVERRKAWFACVVEVELGPEAMTMDYVWRKYSTLRPTHVIEGDVASREGGIEDMDPFVDSLRRHKIMDKDSNEGRMFALYANLANGVISPEDVVRYLPAVSPRWNAFKSMLSHGIKYEIGDEIGDESEPNHGFAVRLKATPELYHPLRERTPSRITSLSTIYATGSDVSVAMAFSGMVWRGATRGLSTTVEVQKYESVKDAADAINRQVKDSKIAGGLLQAVTVYWKNLEQTRWTAFAASKPTFEECYRHLRPPGPLEHKLYPRLGRSGTFDLVGDLAYAGVCRQPEWGDVARHVVHMNAGSMKALRDLGLIDGSKAGVEERRRQVEQALRDVHHLVEEVLEEELGEGTGMRPIELEHALRVFSTASSYLH
ncbi:hypothetical protein MD484_g2074, partial [Candolleomyces efflorescens]